MRDVMKHTVDQCALAQPDIPVIHYHFVVEMNALTIPNAQIIWAAEVADVWIHVATMHQFVAWMQNV